MEPQAVELMKRVVTTDANEANDSSRSELQGFNPSATPMAASPAILQNDEKVEYEGGYTKIDQSWTVAWKPNRMKREMEPVEKLDADAEYKEDMIIFPDESGSPAELKTAEDLMMLVTSIPGPHHLFEPERYFLFPSGSEIKWEDATFYKCGSIKFEQNASRLMEDTSLGTEFWITIVSMACSGAFSDLSEKYDIRGLRITRKKSVVVEFWLGHKDRQYVQEKQDAMMADVVENITTEVLESFLEATKTFMEKEMPSIHPDRWNCQKFFNEE